jgi:hypothetical protein
MSQSGIRNHCPSVPAFKDSTSPETRCQCDQHKWQITKIMLHIACCLRYISHTTFQAFVVYSSMQVTRYGYSDQCIIFSFDQYM